MGPDCTSPAGRMRSATRPSGRYRPNRSVSLRHPGGRAAGTAAAIFPAIGIWGALAAGGAGGAAIGGIAGHFQTGIKRGDLKEMGDVLDKGTAGLIVVYQANMADQISALIKAENRYVSQVVDASADQIAAEIRQAEATYM